MEGISQKDKRGAYTVEEDKQIATLMLNFSSELGMQDTAVTSCRQRQRKYAV